MDQIDRNSHTPTGEKSRFWRDPPDYHQRTANSRQTVFSRTKTREIHPKRRNEIAHKRGTRPRRLPDAQPNHGAVKTGRRAATPRQASGAFKGLGRWNRAQDVVGSYNNRTKPRGELLSTRSKSGASRPRVSNRLNPDSIDQSAGKIRASRRLTRTDGGAPKQPQTGRAPARQPAAHSPRRSNCGSAVRVRRGEAGGDSSDVRAGALREGFGAPGQTKWRLRNIASSAPRLHLRGFLNAPARAAPISYIRLERSVYGI